MNKYIPLVLTSILIACIFLISSPITNAFTEDNYLVSNDAFFAEQNESLLPSASDSFSLNTNQFGMNAPLSLGINYDRLTGFALNGIYGGKVDDNVAFSALGEYGKNMYRISGTAGAILWPKAMGKITLEQLSQVLPFSFTTGNINQRVGQTALGFRIQQHINHVVRNVNVGSYFAKAQNIALSPVYFTSNGINCAGFASGSNCVDYRNIAGGQSIGANVGADILLTDYTSLGGKIYYDNLTYNTMYTASSLYDSNGMGGSLRVNQLLSDHLKLFAEAEVRKIYNTYSGGVAWLPPFANTVNMDVSLSGQQVVSHNATPNSSALALEVTFNLFGNNQPLRYQLDNSSDGEDIGQWIREPAVYMNRVLAVGEERVTLLAPNFFALSSAFGPLSGGNTLFIFGSNFAQGATVYFGNQLATINSISPTSINVTVPAGTSASSVSVTIQNPDYQQVVLSNAYTYVDPLAPQLFSITPNVGSLSGGTSVTLTGTHFLHVQQVKFANNPATNLNVLNDNTLTLTTPANLVEGTVDVTMITDNGVSTLTDAYTFQGSPTLTSITPTQGSVAGGTSIQLSGTNLIGTSSITFDGTPASNIVVLNSTTVNATIPAHSAGVISTIALTNPIGTANLNNAFTYTPSPVLSSISPIVGSVSGGASVTLTGSNLTGTTSVTFDGIAATNVTVVNASTITAVTPAHSLGTVNVVLTNPAGTSTLTNAFTYSPLANLSSVLPNIGPVAGGTSISILGTGLTGTSNVTIGGINANNLNNISDTNVTVVTPTHSAGTVDVNLTTPVNSVLLSSGFTYVDAPIVNNVSPIYGATIGGDTVTITGSDFTYLTNVTFDGTPALSVSLVDDSTITAVTPAHAAAAVNVAVTTPGGTGTLNNAFTYLAQPTLSSLSPTSGTIAGGSLVTISGSNLTHTSNVTFGGIPATQVTVVNNSTVTAVTPAHAIGPVNVVVTTPGGSAFLANAYTYNVAPTITSIQPVSGRLAGGDTVTITGSNLTGTTGITLGGNAATNIFVLSDTTVTAQTPADLAGTVDVVITTPIGSDTLTNGFTYQLAPTLAVITPTSGSIAGGTQVTLTGANLVGTTSVTFGGMPASNIVNVNTTTVTATTPPHLSGMVNVTLTTPSGSSTLMNGFTYNSAPALVSVLPNIGTTLGGTSVTLSGSNFTGATSVTFNGVAATNVAIPNDTTITATTPANTAGGATVSVTTGSGVSLVLNAYTYAAPPTLSSVTPAAGTLGGGTNVTLSGSNLTGTTNVTFGGTPATNVAVVNSTTVTATTPVHAEGQVDVAITTPYGTGILSPGFNYNGAPIITTVSPNVGTVLGGTTVTLSGTNLQNATSVMFDTTPAVSFTVLDDNTVTAITPIHASGAVNVAITTPVGTNTLTNGFTYQGLPILSSVTPDLGTVSGGTMVTLTGTNLLGTTNVTFGATAATNINVVNSATVTAIAPAHVAGVVSVNLTTPTGTTILPASFTYAADPVISAITPNIGNINGGTAIVISGSNFTGTTGVTLGGVAATDVNVVNSTTVTAMTAAHAAGAVYVILTTPIGSGTLSNGYTYTPVPTLSSCGYTSAAVWACVGTNLNVFPNTFINVHGGLSCGLGAGVTSLITTVKNLTQLGGVTTPLLLNNCQVSLCATSTCAGVESNIVTFTSL